MNTFVNGRIHVEAKIVEKLIPIFDPATGKHFSVMVRVDLDRVGKLLGRKAFNSKGKRAVVVDGAVEVRAQV